MGTPEQDLESHLAAREIDRRRDMAVARLIGMWDACVWKSADRGFCYLVSIRPNRSRLAVDCICEGDGYETQDDADYACEQASIDAATERLET